MSKQIKSKERVSKFGEVFTNEREVKAMCDLVHDEIKRIDSKVLEPACGNGNFLVEILSRKLLFINEVYSDIKDYELKSLQAISSIYAIDILNDNVLESRKRMYDIWFENYKNIANKFNVKPRDIIIKNVHTILDYNIICGNFLTMLGSVGEPIKFLEWDWVSEVNNEI
jgi:hypothetical protein